MVFYYNLIGKRNDSQLDTVGVFFVVSYSYTTAFLFLLSTVLMQMTKWCALILRLLGVLVCLLGYHY